MQPVTLVDLNRFFRRVAAESGDKSEIKLARRFLNAPVVGPETVGRDAAMADFEDDVNDLIACDSDGYEGVQTDEGGTRFAASPRRARPALDWLWAHKQEIIDLLMKFIQ